MIINKKNLHCANNNLKSFKYTGIVKKKVIIKKSN